MLDLAAVIRRHGVRHVLPHQCFHAGPLGALDPPPDCAPSHAPATFHSVCVCVCPAGRSGMVFAEKSAPRRVSSAVLVCAAMSYLGQARPLTRPCLRLRIAHGGGGLAARDHGACSSRLEEPDRNRCDDRCSARSEKRYRQLWSALTKFTDVGIEAFSFGKWSNRQSLSFNPRN